MQVLQPGDLHAPTLVFDSLPSGWNHVAVTISNKGVATFYLDGAQQKQGQVTRVVNGVRSANYIGRGAAATDSYFNCGIAMLRLWNRCLDPQSVTASYADPFQELSHPENPLGIFQEHLFHYDRSMIEHRDGRLWLMSGVPNGEWEGIRWRRSRWIPASVCKARHSRRATL